MMILLISQTPVTKYVPYFHKQNILKQKHVFIFHKHVSKQLSLFSYTKPRASFSLTRTLIKSNINYDIEIRKFCDVGNLEKAMNLLFGAKKFNLDIDTYCSLLQLCAERKCLQSGKKVHSIIESNGIEINGVLGSKLVFMYVKCGDLTKGRMIFDKIANEKVFLWNLLINEYAKNGNFDEGINLYRKMQCFCVEPNSHTFTCVLKCFGAKGSVDEGKRVHGYLLKFGFSNADIAVVNSLIAFYFKCGCTESATKVFGETSCKDVITWNSMISGYAGNKSAEKGVGIFIQMLNLGVLVDLVTLVNVLSACASIGVLLLGKSVHGYAVKAGFDKDASFCNTLLDMYSKCDNVDSASRVFETVDEKSVVAWTSMISGYVRHGLLDKAMLLFDDMKKEGVKLDQYTVTSVLHACACCGSYKKGKEVHSYIKENNMHLSLSVCNALLDMYAKCGRMEEAQSIFTQMPIKDIVSWNTMIGGYSKNSFPYSALTLFTEMQQELKPDRTTMACILPACVSIGALDRGREIHCRILRNENLGGTYVHNALIDMYVKCGALNLAYSLFNITPTKDLVTWTVMIAGYAMNGDGNEAISTFYEMTKTGIEPDEVSFVSILCACGQSTLVDLGWRFFNIMRNNCNIEPNLEHYACLVDLLAKSGKLSIAYEVIEKMPIKPDAAIWGALLYGCKIHHDVNLAEKVADRVFELDPHNTEYYLLLADIYAEAQKREKERKLGRRLVRQSLKNPN